MSGYASNLRLNRRIVGYAGAIVATLALGSYLKWAFGFFGIDWALYSSAWRTLFSSRAINGFGPDYESLHTRHPGGLHLYSSLPGIHMGPLSLVYGATPPYQWAIHLEQFSQVGIGLIAGWLLWKMLKAWGQPGWAAGFLLAALAVPWLDAGVRYGHPDVTGVVVMVFVAVYAIRNERWSLLGVAFGISFGISMTTLLFAPLLFVAPAGRDRRRTLALAAGIGALWWLPFILADPATLLHMSAADPATHDSLFGVVLHLATNHRYVGLRLVQSVGCLIAGVVVYRKRGAATALVCVGLLRVALDDATWSYMFLLLITAGAIADILRGYRTTILPISTGMCLLVVVLPFAGDGNSIARAALRTAAIVIALAVELRWIETLRLKLTRAPQPDWCPRQESNLRPST